MVSGVHNMMMHSFPAGMVAIINSFLLAPLPEHVEATAGAVFIRSKCRLA